MDRHLLLLLRATQQQHQQLLQHLQPAAAIPAAVVPPATNLPSERSKDDVSDSLGGASDATAVVLVPGSTTTHTKVNVAATLSHKMSPVSVNFTKF